MTTTTDLITSEQDAPRAVIYCMEEEASVAYIVADKDIKMKIPNPSIQTIIGGLIMCGTEIIQQLTKTHY